MKPVRYNFSDELHHAIKLAAVSANTTMDALIKDSLEKLFLPPKKIIRKSLDKCDKGDTL